MATQREQDLYQLFRKRMETSLTPSLEVYLIAEALCIEEGEVWSAVRVAMNEQSKERMRTSHLKKKGMGE